MAAFCVKALLFVINFVLWLIGSGLIGCTIYILVSEPGTLPYAELELIAGARALCYCVIALGALLFILGFLGCIGGVAEKKGMLKAYMGLLTTLFMGEVGMAVLIWLMESQFITYLQMGWDYLDETTKNLVQNQLNCCGFLNYTEYETAILPSCYVNVTDASTIYDVGCYDKLTEYITDNLVYSASIGGSLVFLEIVGILLSCYMQKAIGKKNDVEPYENSPGPSRRGHSGFRQNPNRYRDHQRAWEFES